MFTEHSSVHMEQWVFNLLMKNLLPSQVSSFNFHKNAVLRSQSARWLQLKGDLHGGKSITWRRGGSFTGACMHSMMGGGSSSPWSRSRPPGWTRGRVAPEPSSFPAVRASFPHSCGDRPQRVCTQMGDDWPWPLEWIWEIKWYQILNVTCQLTTKRLGFFPTSQGWTGQDLASILGHDGGSRPESRTLLLSVMTVRLPHSHVQSLWQTWVERHVLHTPIRFSYALNMYDLPESRGIQA